MITKSRTAKLAAGFVGFAMAVSAFVPAMASADTASDLQAQINSLLATISALQAQLSATTGGGTMMSSYTFNTNLTVGSTGTDVMNLQKVLNGSSDTRVASSGVGSPGSESSYFGGLTKAAVMKFQTKYGISPVAGYVGPITRAKLNTMSGGVVTPVTPGTNPQGGSLSVYAGSQPANSLAPEGAARVPFTNLTVTNTSSGQITVNGITVQRTGLGANAVFSGIVLTDNNNVQIGTSKTLNSNDQATVGDMFILNPGESKALTVAGNMISNLDSYGGQVVGLTVVGVSTSASVSGSFPITGAQQTINSNLAIGTVSTSTSAFDPGTTQTKNIGDTGVQVSGVKFTANSAEDLKLFSLRWRQVGTASAVDVSNVVTIVNGTSYPTVVSSDGKYYTSVFPGGILIPKGNSIDVYSTVDITGSNSNLRTVDLDIDKVTDVYFVGQTYGYGVAASGTYTPWYNGYATTINAGTVTTISKANEVAAQNIAAGVNNQVLGGFATNFAGEPVSISGMVVTLSTSTAGLNGLVTSVSIVDNNGSVVAGPVDATWTSSSNQLATFTDTVTFPTGRHVYTVKGKVPSGASNGAVIQAKTTPSGWTSPLGAVTGSTVNITTGQITMNSMTVKAAALAVNISAQPSAANVVGGTQGLVLANYQLDASQSGEDVRIASFPVKVTETGTFSAADLTGCTLNDNGTPLNTGSRTVNTLVTGGGKVVVSFDHSLVISKGTVKTLVFECNLASVPSATAFQVNRDNTDNDYSITGVTSGTGVTPTYGAATVGGLMTVAGGSLAASIDASSPSYALAAGGSTGQTMSVIKLRATNDNINVTKIGLILTAVTTGNSTNVAGNLTQVYLYKAGDMVNPIGTAIFASGATVATSTLSSPLTLIRDTDTLITVKADLADVSSVGSAVEGDLVKIDLDSTEGTGVGSGSTVRTGAATGVAGVRVFNTFPVIALDSLSSTGIGDGRLMRFKVTADSHGDVGINKFTFTLATSTLTVSNIGLFGYSDASYSTAMSGNFAVGGTNSSGQVDENLATSTTNACGSAPGINQTIASSTCVATGSLITLVYRAATNPVEIPAGTTRYFELRGSITGNATNASVVTKMLSDSSVSTSTATGIASSNFIWSPNATSTSVFLSNDWTTGYGIIGFPTSGLLQSRGF